MSAAAPGCGPGLYRNGWRGRRASAAGEEGRGRSGGGTLDQNGEHLILVDEKGRILKEEQLLALLSLGVLKYSPVNTIAIPVTAPRFFEEVVNTYRGKVVRTKANPRALMEKVAEERLFPGGHEQTHFQPAFDGIYSLAKLLELMAKEKVGLSELSGGSSSLLYSAKSSRLFLGG